MNKLGKSELKVLVSFLLIVAFVGFMSFSFLTSGAWYDDTYDYKRNITNASTNLLLPLNCSGGSDCTSDIDSNGDNEVLYGVPSGSSASVYYNDDTDAVTANDTTETCIIDTENDRSSCPTTPDGLVSSYQLDRSSGDVKDYIGNNDGTNNGATRGVSGKINNAFDFDDDKIEISSTDFAMSEISASMWVNIDNFEADNIPFLAISEGDSNQRMSFILDGDTNNEISIWDGDDGWHNSGITPNTDEWIHLVFIRTQDKKIIYQNGNEIMNEDVGSSNYGNRDKIQLGRSQWNPSGEYLNGKIDEVQIYDRALSSSEVETLYNANDASLNDEEIEEGLNNPPNEPVLNYPQNNLTGIETNPELNITVSDPEGDDMNVSFYNITNTIKNFNISNEIYDFKRSVINHASEFDFFYNNETDFTVNGSDNSSLLLPANCGKGETCYSDIDSNGNNELFYISETCAYDTLNGNVNCPTTPEGLVSHYALDRDSGDVKDYIGNNDGTNNGATRNMDSGSLFSEEKTNNWNTDSHQGVAWGKEYFYTTDTDHIYKYSTDGTLIEENTNPNSDISASTNHLGDVDYYDGKLYIAVEDWGSCSDFSEQTIAVFNASDLSYIEEYDISGQNHEVSGVLIDEEKDEVVVSDYCSDTLHFYDLDDFSYKEGVDYSESIGNVQGVTNYSEHYLVQGDSDDTTYLVKRNGDVILDAYSDYDGGGAYEGATMKDNQLVMIVDEGTTSKYLHFANNTRPLKRAFKFDGEDDYISLPDTTDFEFDSAFSIGGWVYWDGSNPEEYFIIFSKYRDEDDTDNGYFLGKNKNDALIFNVRKSAGRWDGFTSNSWYHVVGVWDESEVKLYVNGDFKDSEDLTTAPSGTDQEARIGNAVNKDEPFSGSLDDIQVYDRALSEEEISTLYNSNDVNLGEEETEETIKDLLDTQTGILNNTDVTYEWANLNQNQTYNWNVEVTDNNSQTTTSDDWEFTTELENSPPNQPTLNNPEDNETGVSTDPTLNVTVSDPDGDDMNVSFYDASDDSLIGEETEVTNGSDATTTWSDLSEETTYDWYVEVIDNNSQTTTSDTWEFTTGDFTPPSVNFFNQTPTDLTSDNLFNYNNRLNITYNITDNNLDTSTVKLNYKTNTSDYDTTYYLNGSAISGWIEREYDNNYGDIFEWLVPEWKIYPITHNLDKDLLTTTEHNSYTLDSEKDWIKTRLFNTTASAAHEYNYLELMANSSAETGSLGVWYCNSSYTSGTEPTKSDYCAKFYDLEPNKSYDYDENKSFYHQIPFTYNQSTLKIDNVKITNTSQFILQGSKNTNWNVYTVPNITRADQVQTSTDGKTWNNYDGTTDLNLRMFNGHKYRYYSCANDTYDNQNCSEQRVETFELEPLPPIDLTFYSPISKNYSNNILINYSEALSPSGNNIDNYNISLVSENETFEEHIHNNELNTSYEWDSSEIEDGNYKIKVTACDNESLCSNFYSQEFEISKIKDFNITVINPKDGSEETSNPVLFKINTTSETTCNYNLNKGENKSMSSSDNITFKDSQDLEDDKDYTAYFFCNSTSDSNINDTANTSFYFREESGGAGGGGSSGGIDEGTVGSEDTLGSFEVFKDVDKFYFNETNSVYIETYDDSGDKVDVNNITAELKENYNFTYNVLRVGEGKYKVNFQVEEEFDKKRSLGLTFEVTQNSKKLDKTNYYTFYPQEEETTKEKIDDVKTSGIDFWNKYKTVILIGFGVLALLILFGILTKNREQ